MEPEDRPSKLDSFKEYLKQRLAAVPELNSKLLLKKIREQGFAESYDVVKRFVAPLRAADRYGQREDERLGQRTLAQHWAEANASIDSKIELMAGRAQLALGVPT